MIGLLILSTCVASAQSPSGKNKLLPVWEVRFSPDGRYVAAGLGERLYHRSEDAQGEAAAWEISSGVRTKLLEKPVNFPVWGFSFSSSDLLAIGYHNVVPKGPGSPYRGSRIRILKWEKKKELLELEHKQDGGIITQLTFSPDGKWLAAARVGGVPICFNLETRKPAFALDEHVSSYLVFSQNGKDLWSCCADKPVVNVLDAKNGKLRRTIALDNGTFANWIECDNNGSVLIGCFKEKRVFVFQYDLEKVTKAIALRDDRIGAMAMAVNRGIIAVGYCKSGIDIVDCRTGKLVTRIGRDLIDVNCLAFSPNGHSLVVGTGREEGVDNERSGGSITIWDVKTGKKLRSLE